MFTNIAVKILANAGAIWAADRYITGLAVLPVEFVHIGLFSIPPSIQTLLVGGIALAAANIILHPPLRVIAAVLPFITTAMLAIVANGIILYLGDAYLAELTIDALKPLALGAILLGVVNSLL